MMSRVACHHITKFNNDIDSILRQDRTVHRVGFSTDEDEEKEEEGRTNMKRRRQAWHTHTQSDRGEPSRLKYPLFIRPTARQAQGSDRVTR